MGRIGSGVEVRPNSIRLSFTADGQQQRHTLMLNGEPMPPTPANVKYAHRVAAEIKDRIRHGTLNLQDYFPATGNNAAGQTVAAQLTAWLAAQRIEASTRMGYSSAAKFWTSAPCDDRLTPLGTLPLRAVRHSHILRALASRPTLSGKTVNNYVSVLRESLALAVLDKILTENPAEQVPRAKSQKEPPEPFSREEIEAISQAMRQRHPGQSANMTEFWLWTGLRTSEIFGLKWPHIDLSAGTMQVSEAVVQGRHKKNTKTNVARTVKLNSRALAALKAQQQYTQLDGAAVFHDPRYDTPWSDERAFRRSYWTPTLKSVGVRYRRPYDMRHTYATQMLMAGMTPAFCARQLGHSVEIFLRTYAKWLDGVQNDLEMARLEKAISSPILP